jgi:nicotinamidase/pyrazinamidase
MKNILLIVDPQNDFITGSLAVEGAKEKMMKLAEYINGDHPSYDYICVTMDTHPTDHCSFKENGGIWPAHCVYDTNGWDLPEYLNEALKEANFVSCYHKGTEPDHEEYSIFDNERDGFTLYSQIKDLIHQEDVFISVCGIAGDFCVLETLKGLRKYIGDNYINILWDYTASIDGGIKLFDYAKLNEINIVSELIKE